MRSRDVAKLYGAVPVRTRVAVLNTRLNRAVAQATLLNANGSRVAARQPGTDASNRQRAKSSSGKRLSATSAKSRRAI